MPHAVGLELGHQGDGAVEVEEIELVKREPGMPGDVGAFAQKEVVGAGDLVASREQPWNEVRGDESGRAGDENSQDPSRAARVFASSSGVPMSKKS
jgi:hypothetical protein